MIPEALHLRNFMSHRETDLDLRGVHLASLVGDNGAGKSALLDAMTWAIWGRSRTPYGHDDDLVYHGESDLEVEFVFRMPYQSGLERRCRILRRREQRSRRAVSSMLDFQIETEEGWRVLTSDSIRETQQLIIDTLGLDYDTFINSAYLRQGHDDEFTIQSPTERKRVLSAILGLDRWAMYQDRVKIKLSDIQGQMTQINRRLDETEAELARRPEFETALKEAEAAAEAAESDLQDVQAQVDELTRIQEQALALRRELNDLNQRRAEVTDELARLEDEATTHRERRVYYEALVTEGPEIESRYQAYQEVLREERALGEKLSQAAQLQEERSGLEAEIAEARDALSRQLRTVEQEERRLERAVEDARSSLERTLSEMQSQLAMLKERMPTDRLKTELAGAKQTVAELEAIAQELEEVQGEVQRREVEQSRVTERNRQLRDAMEETKARLDALAEAEANCPLCGQPLSPKHHRELLEEIETQGRTMGDEYRKNRQDLSDLEGNLQQLRNRIPDLERQVRMRSTHEQKLARLQQQLEQGEEAHRRAGEVEEQIAALQEQLERQVYAQGKREELAKVVEEKERYQTQLETQAFALEARQALHDVLTQLADVGYDSEAHGRVKTRLATLAEAEKEYRELEKARIGVEGEVQALARLELQVAAQQRRAEQLEEARAEQASALAALEPRLAEAPALTERLHQLREQATRARQRVGAARQNLVALDTLAQRLTGMRESREKLASRIGVLTELRDAFGVNGIPAMIIEHTLPELEREANRILQQLSGGRMHVRFETQRETKTGNLRETLDIIISDEKGTRPYESFSGGEKFRINFAIRVALSCMLAQRSGVRLRSLFVDEGFGALDTDGRQRLVEAVKAVQSEFDLVLIITHIDELREAFPTQIQVTKTDSGSLVEVM